MDDSVPAFQEAATAADALLALDALASSGQDDLPVADMYDDLAAEAAEEGDFGIAVTAQRRALELGCRDPRIGEEMLGWYLYDAGTLDEARAHFAALRKARGGDLHLDLTEALALDSSGHRNEALAAFDGILAAAEPGEQDVIDQARAERRDLRAEMGLAPDERDRLAPRPLPDGEGVAVPWFPRDEHRLALDRWPDLAGELIDADDYCRSIELLLRRDRAYPGPRPQIAPITVDRVERFAAERGLDPASANTRAHLATEIARHGEPLAWPPGRNETCWCGSGTKYKRCCGSG